MTLVLFSYLIEAILKGQLDFRISSSSIPLSQSLRSCCPLSGPVLLLKFSGYYAYLVSYLLYGGKGGEYSRISLTVRSFFVCRPSSRTEFAQRLQKKLRCPCANVERERERERERDGISEHTERKRERAAGRAINTEICARGRWRRRRQSQRMKRMCLCDATKEKPWKEIGAKKGASLPQHHTPSYLIQRCWGPGLLCLAGPGPLRSIPPTKELLLAIPINIASFSSLPHSHSQALVQASKSSLQHGCYYFFPSSPYRDHCFVPRDHATFITVQRPTGVYFR